MGETWRSSERQYYYDTPNARRLFEFLIKQRQDAVSTGDEQLFPGLITAWDNEEHDPKDNLVAVGAIAGISGFRLAEIETEGFGGINIFGGPTFSLGVDRQSWCLEGQNGSGKTSLVSAIIWGLTGRRIREQSGPVPDEGIREPVLDNTGNKIGTWPPLATYPTNRDDLNKDAHVRVKLTFIDASGDEALVERIIVSKADGTTKTEKETVDPRLLSAPQLLDSGILMPSRMAHISFGDRSQSLYEAVKSLTGLDQLGAVGDGAVVFTHGARKFLKYAKDNGIDKIENDYTQIYAVAKEPSDAVGQDLSKISDFSDAKIVETLGELIKSISNTAGNFAKTLKAVVTDKIDVSLPEGRKQVSEALGVAKDTVKTASDKVGAFIVLKELYKANKAENLADLPDAITEAEQELETALGWHAHQQDDLKLRLKALAAQWYEVPENPDDLANCPLCESDLQTPKQQELQKELNDLKTAGEKAGRQIGDVCRDLRDGLIARLPEVLQQQIDVLGQMEPKSDISGAALQLFAESEPFSDIFVGAGDTLKRVIPANAENLPAFEPADARIIENGEPDSATALRNLVYQLQRTLELADWWDEHRATFAEFWKAVLGIVDEDQKPNTDTVLGQIAIIEEALTASQPYDVVLDLLNKLLGLATSWHAIMVDQKKRAAIAAALMPLKSLRTFVDSEAARSIAELSTGRRTFLNAFTSKSV